ncbi:MAG: sulfatase-like hydrolase/transferase [Planctomycetes bacterium]|nr:sulfatase-like hydrolase/transferase [Planctomycetota bacterium]
MCANEAAKAKQTDASNRRARVNVLFLVVDDLNDWVGCLGGHPQAKTPNIDKLAKKGVLFEHAYCAAPLCNPSRTSVMTGLRPSTTGIYRPHLSWYVPKKYFDMHPIDKVRLPAYLENDLDDVPPRGHAMAGQSFGIIKRRGQWKNAVQGYLAASSFADACVGRVLDALEQSKYRDDTIVVLWGDHGYHIGEKNHFAKSALWQQTTHTPLIIYAPDDLPSGAPANRSRIGRIDPKAPDGNIKEWNPPFRGPRRLHVAPDGIVWVPGFGSGVFGKFDPKTEKWTVYDLPDADNQIPYALNVDPKGYVWICGTGNDTLNRFDPKTERLVVFRLPTRVSYTREIEFDSAGNVWTSTSGPARHMERAYGSIIKLEVLGDDGNDGGQRLVGYVPRPEDLTYEQPRVVNYKDSPNGTLLARIDHNELPKAYRSGKQHQVYVDRRLAGLSPRQRARIGRLWAEKRKADPDMPNAGHSFVKIMEHVAENEKSQQKTGGQPQQ